MATSKNTDEYIVFPSDFENDELAEAVLALANKFGFDIRRGFVEKSTSAKTYIYIDDIE